MHAGVNVESSYSGVMQPHERQLESAASSSSSIVPREDGAGSSSDGRLAGGGADAAGTRTEPPDSNSEPVLAVHSGHLGSHTLLLPDMQRPSAVQGLLPQGQQPQRLYSDSMYAHPKPWGLYVP